ncbi:MAG: hypothetical protein JWM14_2750 [Chitinophagaceae bacterium]|nr:hypothetical protein [Chitinophagaceae bacterium]
MMTYQKIGSYSLLAVGLFLILSSCSKKSDPYNATPDYVDYSKYPWYAYLDSNEDTIQIKNNELYICMAPRDINNTNQELAVSSVSRFQPVTGDFEMSLDYEKASNFFLDLISNNQKDKDATVSVDNDITTIGWGTSYQLQGSYDFESSTSGTITVKRTGQTLKVTILKNYISGGVPTQKTQEASCPNFYDGKTSMTFSSLPFTGTAERVTFKRFSLTDNTGKTIIDNFSSSDSLYVSRKN